MNTLLLFFLLCATAASAAIEIRLSVKFIGMPNGQRPQSFTPAAGQADISTQAGVDAAITAGNAILARYGRGYVVRVVESFDIQPPTPPGQAQDYWFNMDPRNGPGPAQIEGAAVLSPSVWRYNSTAVNLYINNSGSGSCCGLVRRSITLGKNVRPTTILHEVGHLMGLPHTFGNGPLGEDEDCGDLPPPLSQYVNDGDGLADTAPDSSCFNDNAETGAREDDQLSQALFSKNYSALNTTERASVDSSLRNLMSYHIDRRLLTQDQNDVWTDTANQHQAVGFAVGDRSHWVDRNNDCTGGLPPLYSQYQWWVNDHPLPGPSWGARLPASVTINPTLPEPPFGYPPTGPRPPSNLYPAAWPWPPTDLPEITFCIGGPVKTLTEGLTLAAPGDQVIMKPGTYTAGARLTGRVTLRSSRGTARLTR